MYKYSQSQIGWNDTKIQHASFVYAVDAIMANHSLITVLIKCDFAPISKLFVIHANDDQSRPHDQRLQLLDLAPDIVRPL
jgi:hypothetical protein